MKRIFLIPIFIALYPVLLLYARNLNELTPEVLFLPAFVFTVSGWLFFLAFSWIFKNREKSVLFTSLFILFFSTFGHLASGLEKTFLAPLAIKFTSYLLLFWLVVFIIIVYLIFKIYAQRNKKSAVLSFFFYFSLSLVAIPTFTIIFHRLTTNFPIKSTFIDKVFDNSLMKNLSQANKKTKVSLPDIYYIIFDRYAQAASLKKYYGYDNSEFTKFLADNGFYVAQNSFANYPITDISLASSLNMNYLDKLSKQIGRQLPDFGPLHRLLKNHQLGRLLKRKEYTYIHLGSTWGPTSTSDLADINDKYRPPLPLSAFSFKLWEMTAFYPLMKRPVIILGKQLSKSLSFEELSRATTLYQLEKIPQIALNKPSPKFIFAHILLPHEPYVFRRNGGFIPRSEAVVADRKKYYLNQLIYGNLLIKKMVKKLLQNTEGKAVIILQADEGPLPARYKANEYGFDWHQATTDEIREKLGILNAYFLPGQKQVKLYPEISPVNTFRLIFNLYLGTNLPLLPDKHFVISNRLHPYDFIDVTDKL